MQKTKQKGLLVGKTFEIIFTLSSIVSILALIAILAFIMYRGLPSILDYGIFNFLTKSNWAASYGEYGILSMIVGSIAVTLGAIIIGVPLGILCAVFLSEIASDKLKKIVQPAIELLAGIPSVIYGFFGLLAIVPLINSLFGGGGDSILAAIFILTVMILPTIVTLTQTALESLPSHYKEGSLALGASHIQTIFNVMIPAAKSAILSAVILGIGRAIGETMAVILVMGNSIQMPSSLLSRGRTMTANIALEMGYAPEYHQNMLFGIGVVLLIFIMILNYFLMKITNSRESK